MPCGVGRFDQDLDKDRGKGLKGGIKDELRLGRNKQVVFCYQRVIWGSKRVGWVNGPR